MLRLSKLIEIYSLVTIVICASMLSASPAAWRGLFRLWPITRRRT
jgi:hypothetical protein